MIHFRFVDQDIFMRHLGGGIGHTTNVPRMDHSHDLEDETGHSEGEGGIDAENSEDDGITSEDSNSQSDSAEEDDTGYASL